MDRFILDKTFAMLKAGFIGKMKLINFSSTAIESVKDFIIIFAKEITAPKYVDANIKERVLFFIIILIIGWFVLKLMLKALLFICKVVFVIATCVAGVFFMAVVVRDLDWSKMRG
ncbi:hypothetical protein F53441_6880 [Fusarium austroafricanum]|uniref:Uncharacterized protein n=1 Tax=Fusarium austroafricanum TaxID=2364996 RepID=A0A8H4KGZ1_9HYPO|nr:hypothetical protein F53441_6880 [Fusarium austroafricanum]